MRLKTSGNILKTATLLIILLAAAAMPRPASAQNTQNFTIQSFSAHYYLSRASDHSSNMSVTEQIIAQFPDFDQNHGILRAIPETYQNHRLTLSVQSVTNASDEAYPYTTYPQNDNLVLKIGSPSVYVHGQVEYVIKYQLSDVISFYKDHDELFWDINGDQWQQQFDSVTASFSLPSDLAANLNPQMVCYTGVFGSKDQSQCSITKNSSGQQTVINSYTKSPLGPGQTMSVALSFKPGTFVLSPAAKHDQQSHKQSLVGAILLGAGLPLGVFIFMFMRWRKVGNDPKGRGVIIPQYEPPQGLDVLYLDYIYKEKLRSVAISAAIIDLAIKGCLTIYEVPKKGLFGHKSYKIKFNQQPKNMTPDLIKAISTALGPDNSLGTEVDLYELAHDSSHRLSARQDFQELEKSIPSNLAALGYFKQDPRKAKTTYSTIGVVILFTLLYFGSKIISAHSLVIDGLFGGLILSGLIFLAFSFIMPARNDKGVEVYDWLLGLRDYIKLAAADRLKYLQSPDGAEKIAEPNQFDPKQPAQRVKLFESLLPYAMLFELEKDWAKQFNDVYTTPPTWFVGNWTSFNAGYLAGSVGNFNSFGSKTFAAPTSGGSGFGGGGAGGGGGGGGGGGW